MKRGLPKDGASLRDARIRRASAAPRARASSSTATAAWWHQPLLWVLLLVSAPLVKAPSRGDEAQPLALVRSVVIHHTWDSDLAGRGAHASPAGGVGPSLLWSPFFLAAHAGVGIAQSRGSQIAADGRSWPYVRAAAFGTAFYAFLALWMSFRLAMRVASPAAALVATLAIWLASSLPIYLYAVPFSAHVAAMFSAALVLTIWMSVRDGRDGRARWFAWGLASGLAVTTSLFTGALLVVVLIEWVARMVRPGGFVESMVNGLVFLAGAAGMVAPAMAMTGTGLPVFHLAGPQLVAAAWATSQAAFVWTPILALAVLGLAVAARRQPALGATFLMVGACAFYLVAAYAGSVGEASYGSQFLVAITPIFVCGLAALVDAVAGGRGRAAWAGVAALASVLVLWNLGMMLQWSGGLIPASGPVDFRQAAANQVTVVPRAAKEFVIRYINERTGLVSTLEGGARE